MTERILYKPSLKSQNSYNVWCAFPAVYNFAMSALGYMTVFQHIDMLEGIYAERICTDTEKTSISLNNVNLISFSVSFELDYAGILAILKKYNIHYFAKDRHEEEPLICGGGPVLSSNPEPFAPFFDFIMVGDSEPQLKQIFEVLRDNRHKPKKEQLELISHIPGIYVPALKSPSNKVQKVSSCMAECVASPVLTPNSFFPDTFIIETERGCPEKCAFCLTSYINNPVRFCSYEQIIEKLELGLKYTNKIALLGALICSHPKIDDICEYIIKKSELNKNIEVSVSSLRADYVSDKTLEMLHKCGQRTATIAIEAGSGRLRSVINKNLKHEDIISTVEKMYSYGFNGVKIYGIIGLPTETYEDLDAFLELCLEIKHKCKGFNVIPSFSTFVPKAQTPFQWAAREDTKSLEKKIEYINKNFQKSGIKPRTGSAKWDYIQTLISRGSSLHAGMLVQAFENGASLGAFRKLLNTSFRDLSVGVNDEINLCKELPWDFIEYKKTKEQLKAEYIRLLGER